MNLIPRIGVQAQSEVEMLLPNSVPQHPFWPFQTSNLASALCPAAAHIPVRLPHPVDLHIIRHGETIANVENLVTGARDVPLTERGRIQAKQAGAKLSPHYDFAFSSKLERSKETLWLALEAGRVRVAKCEEDPRLNERGLGELELQPSRSLPEYAAGNLAYSPPGGESYLAVTEKVLSFLTDVFDLVQRTGARRILISSHMGPMRIMEGILREETNPVTVLNRSFRNGDVIKYNWSRFAWPKFQMGKE